MTFTRFLCDWKILRFCHRLAGFFVYSSEELICIAFLYKITKYVWLQSIYTILFFLRKRNLIILFPVTNGTFDPVSVLMLM